MESSRPTPKSNPVVLIAIAILLLVVIAVGFILAILVRWLFNLGGTLGVVVMVVAGLGFLVFVWALMSWRLRVWKIQMLLKDDGAIRLARGFAPEAGTIVRDGPTTIWYSGPGDPVPMLREEFAAALKRFQSLVKERVVPPTPRLILAFHKMETLSRFVRWVHPGMIVTRPLQGTYVEPPLNVVILCPAELPAPYRDPRTVAGAVASSANVELFYPALPAQWTRSGLAMTLQAPIGPAAVVLLNRQMVVALESGTAWPSGPFSVSAAEMISLVERVDQPGAALKVELFSLQSWSVVEYLIGRGAPNSSRKAFRAYLKDATARDRPEASFYDYFGYDFASLNESWREWVLDQGIGPDLPPSPRIRAALATRLLPLIGDRSAPRKDRVEAVREWRRAGYAMGAQLLIDLLRDPGDIPKDELVWALAMASGDLLGDDPDAWQAWYDTLPGECR